MTLLRTALALFPFIALACDLPPKDIGDASETDSGDGSGGTGNDTGAPCVDGDQAPSADGCNTCVCIEGGWACTERGCADDGATDDGVAPVCEDGEQMPAPDGCNTCACIGGAWACTQIGCTDTGAPVCEDGEEMPAPDGCNTCTCEDGEWGCTKIECGSSWFGDEILVCDPGAPLDAVYINSVVVENDALVVDVSYGGGCEDHDFGLCWDGLFLESNPVQINSFVSHEDHSDPCDAYPNEVLVFDLVPLRDQYQSSYQTPNGEVVIRIDGWAESILYSF